MQSFTGEGCDEDVLAFANSVCCVRSAAAAACVAAVVLDQETNVVMHQGSSAKGSQGRQFGPAVLSAARSAVHDFELRLLVGNRRKNVTVQEQQQQQEQ